MKTNIKPAPARNHEGVRVSHITPAEELKRAILACMLWENNFYENGVEISARIKNLIPRVDPNIVSQLAIEARVNQNLRHIPLFIVREMARLNSHKHLVAKTLESVIMRADELSEFLALYFAGKKQPLSAQVKKGLAAAFRKFDGYQLQKYNRDAAIKLKDVLFLCHAKPKDKDQEALWKKLINDELETPYTWETELSGGADKRKTFTDLIEKNMLGGMAMLRNLRNMEQSGVPREIIKKGLAQANFNRVLPFRFITAAQHAPALEPELEKAMFAALSTYPKFNGRVALVIDTSPSMKHAKVSEKSELDRLDAACALAMLVRELSDDINIYTFNHKAYHIAPRRGFALRDVIKGTVGEFSCGESAILEANKAGYDTIICLTDGQWHGWDAATQKPQRGIMQDGWIKTKPLANSSAFMLNISTYKNGVGYGDWNVIHGWSEASIAYALMSQKS